MLESLSNLMTFRCPAVCLFNTFLSSTFLVTVLTLDVIIKHHPISYFAFLAFQGLVEKSFWCFIFLSLSAFLSELYKRRAYLLSTFAHRPFQELILVFPAGGEGPHQGGPEDEGLRPKEELLGAQP